jgi:hypothetical protein
MGWNRDVCGGDDHAEVIARDQEDYPHITQMTQIKDCSKYFVLSSWYYDAVIDNGETRKTSKELRTKH